MEHGLDQVAATEPEKSSSGSDALAFPRNPHEFSSSQRLQSLSSPKVAQSPPRELTSSLSFASTWGVSRSRTRVLVKTVLTIQTDSRQCRWLRPMDLMAAKRPE